VRVRMGLTWAPCLLSARVRARGRQCIVRTPKMFVIVSEHEWRGWRTYLGRINRVGDIAGGVSDGTAGGRRRDVAEGGGGEQRGRVAPFEPTPPDLAKRGPRSEVGNIMN